MSPSLFWLAKRGIYIIRSSSRKEAVRGGSSSSSCYMMREIRIEVLIFRSIQNSPQYYLLVLLYLQNAQFKLALTFPLPLVSFLLLSVLRFWSLLVLYLSCIQSTLHRIVSTLVFHVSVNRSFLEGGNVATNVDSLQRNAGSSIKSRAQQRLK